MHDYQRDKPKKLTNKQIMFIQEYLVDLNGTQAAIRAGYSKASANVISSEMLTKPYIQEAIAKKNNERLNKTEVKADQILIEMARLAFVDIRKAFDEKGQLLPIPDMPEDVARALSGIEISTIPGSPAVTSKVKFIDKKGALEMLGRHVNLFAETKLHVIDAALDDMELARRVAFLLTEDEYNQEVSH